MPKYVPLKHYRGGPEPHHPFPPMDQWVPEDVEAHMAFLRQFRDLLDENGEYVAAQALTPAPNPGGTMTSTTPDQRAVRLQRTIPAPPDRVYRAWLEPDLLRRWPAPPGLVVSRAEVDERVGGAHRIWHAHGDVEAGGFESELVELDPAKRIVFRWGFVGPERLDGPHYDSRLTITLNETADSATDLTLAHERLDELEAGMPGMADSVAVGWDYTLDVLAATCGEAA